MIADERDLVSAPRAVTVDPIRAQAADVAAAHARTLINLPPFDLVWVSRPGGYRGQIDCGGGRCSILLNADLPEFCHRQHPMANARDTAWVVLHEVGHARDARLLHVMSDTEAELRANEFAGWAMETFPWEELG